MSSLRRGKPRHQATIKKNAGISLSIELIEALNNLPQVQSEWSKSYLVEQILRNYLNLPSDFDWDDLVRVARGRVIE
jgi:predicted DNA-binding protein